ncbi:MAG: HD domain-containing protein, partial [Chromatiales bacterium]|nr:HD domain-containing protein [Chromatiales bacterium]
ATIEGFGAMAEYRDPETGGHIKRTQNYVKVLAHALKSHPRFQESLDEASIDLMHRTAPLHDIGKIGIPDEILLKPGRLTRSEFQIMEQHTKLGADVINIIMSKVGHTDFLKVAKEIILCHQEKWDGTGYPQQLKGEEIPVSARLMAVADVYDALISRRVYKPPYSHKTAIRMIAAEKAKHFDPDVIDAFLAVQDQFLDIALLFLDDEEQHKTLLSDDDLTAV